MSGIEVVGLVIGVIPLVISAADEYKKGLQPFLRWKRFTRTFQNIINAVDIQQRMFQAVLTKLLVRVELGSEERQKLLTVPGYDGWHRSDVIEAVKSRLSGSYDAFMGTVKEINQDMEAIHDIICTKGGSTDWTNPGTKEWKYQVKRIHLSYDESVKKTVDDLSRKIQNLNTLLDLLDSTDNTLHGVKAVTKDTTWGKFFENVRHQASYLHSALRNSWICDCESHHVASLQLQRRQASDQASLQFTANFNLHQPGRNETDIYRTLSFRPKKEKDRSKLEGTIPAPTDETYIEKLRMNFESRLLLEEKEIKPVRSNLRPLYPLKSSSSTLVNLISKDRLTLSSTSMDPSKNGSESIADTKSRTLGSTEQRAKIKKTLRWQTEPALGANPSIIPELVDDPNSSINQKIDDLCSLLKDPNTNLKCLGYLSDGDSMRHEVWASPITYQVSQIAKTISLDSALSGKGPVKLTRQKRYKIASIMASSVLQLQTTPWLDWNLEKKHISLYCLESDVIAEPYISHNFTPTPATRKDGHPTPSTKVVARTLPRNALSSLGILLLELLFGEAIESKTEIRSKHLSSDGKALEGTDFLTARDWLDEVEEEEPRMLPVIRWCLYCLFEGKPNWENTKFTQAIYDCVVKPLEMLVAPI